MRRRFLDALRRGYSTAEASAYGNDANHVLPKLAGQESVPVAEADPVPVASASVVTPPVPGPDIEPCWKDNGGEPAQFADPGEAEVDPQGEAPAPAVAITEDAKARKPVAGPVEIPQNWEQLVWPQLRDLALACGAKPPLSSRTAAFNAIRQYQAAA